MKLHGKSFVALLVLAIGLAAGGGSFAANFPDSVKKLVGDTRKQIKTMDMAAFKQALEKKDGLIVDVREEDEYDAGHVPGAINIPRGLLEFVIWDEVGFPDKTDMNKKMYLYCKTGGRCTLAAKSLQDLGFTNVTAVVMKFEDWKKAGNPVEVEKTKKADCK